jgi:hypothetical protein
MSEMHVVKGASDASFVKFERLLNVMFLHVSQEGLLCSKFQARSNKFNSKSFSISFHRANFDQFWHFDFEPLVQFSFFENGKKVLWIGLLVIEYVRNTRVVEEDRWSCENLWQEDLDLYKREVTRMLWLGQVVPCAKNFQDRVQVGNGRRELLFVKVDFDHDVFKACLPQDMEEQTLKRMHRVFIEFSFGDLQKIECFRAVKAWRLRLWSDHL